MSEEVQEIRKVAIPLDFKNQSIYRHPSYKYTPCYPNTFGQSIALGSSQIPSTINLPPEVHNDYESCIAFTLNLTAVASRYIWLYEDVLAPLVHLQKYANTNDYIVDLDNANKYMKATKCEFDLEDYRTLDPINSLYPNNSLTNVVPAVRHSGSINATPAPSQQAYTESAYFKPYPLNTAVTRNYIIPLRFYKNTAFAVNKDVYYGVTSYLKIYFDVISKICYQSTSNASPSAGTPEAYTGTATITNLQLLLAQESSNQVAEQVKAEHMKGLEYMIPWVRSYKNSNSGSSQQITIQFDVGSGVLLSKVFHQVYNNTESLDTAYDCANNGTLVDGSSNATSNQKVQQFYTMLNSKREQDLTLDCTYAGNIFSDYLYMKKKLKKSMVENLNVYQYNWVWCSDYSEVDSYEKEHESNSLISGIPLTNSPLTWTFNGLVMTNATYQHYTWAVFYKKIALNGNGVRMSP